jgi:hypothetical protein
MSSPNHTISITLRHRSKISWCSFYSTWDRTRFITGAQHISIEVKKTSWLFCSRKPRVIIAIMIYIDSEDHHEDT